MGKTRVLTHVEKSWTGTTEKTWAKFIAWIGKHPEFVGTINVIQYPEWAPESEEASISILIESDAKEV